MKKVPTQKVIEQRNSMIESLKKDDYRGAPSQEVIKQRLIKRKHRERSLRELENKFQFEDMPKEAVKSESKPKANTKKNEYNMSNKTTDQLIEKFKKLSKLKKQLDNCHDCKKVNKIPTAKGIIQQIYHTIETEKMNGYDMYNMINALQYQLRAHKEHKTEEKRENIKKMFDNIGGIQLYLKLKSYLKDIGVNTNELY